MQFKHDSKHIAARESELKNETYEKYTAPDICRVECSQSKKHEGEVSCEHASL